MASVHEIEAPQSTNVISERESEKPKLEEEELQGHVSNSGSDGADSDSDSCSYDDGRYYEPRDDADIEEFLSKPVFVDDRLNEDENEAVRSYLTQYRKSDGFDVDIFPIVPWIGGLRPVDLKDQRDMEAVTSCAKYAIKRHNAKRPEKLEFVDVIKAIGGCSNPYMFLVTLNARVIATKEIKIYQAHVEGLGDDATLYTFRPKPEGTVALT